MAIPDTNGSGTSADWSLQTVVGETGSEGWDLVDCFADAVAGNFDSSYNPNSVGTSNNLLNFRNYNGSVTGNQLYFVLTSSGGTSGFYLSNATLNSYVDVKCTYVSKVTGDLPITVRESGVVRSPGYSFTGTLALDSQGGWFGRGGWDVTSTNFGTGSTVTFKMEITSTNVDTLPSPSVLTNAFNYYDY